MALTSSSALRTIRASGRRSTCSVDSLPFVLPGKRQGDPGLGGRTVGRPPRHYRSPSLFVAGSIEPCLSQRLIASSPSYSRQLGN